LCVCLRVCTTARTLLVVQDIRNKCEAKQKREEKG